MRKYLFPLTSLAMLAACGAALADAPITNWLQNPVTPLAEAVRADFWNNFWLTLPFLLIPQIVLVLVIFKFRASLGHAAATWHENPKLEFVWTAIPVLTLILVAIPAYSVLVKMEVPPKSDLVVEVIGHQFFWEYRYPRYGVIISNEPLVVPANKVVTINATSVDVIHAWWVPAFGVKQDANPGRISHAWFSAREGRYKGQCAELCGTLHGEMLIDVNVLPQADFDNWIKARMPADTTGASATSTSREP
ncbi:MAG TPA: cytochrome c oxidase subunit II [bacterium]